MNQTYSDEILMAYADGALSGAEAAGIRASAAADPATAARIQAFQASGRLLRETFGPVLEQPVPPRLQRAVAQLGEREPLSLAYAGHERRAVPRRARRMLPALALGLMLGLVVTAAWRVNNVPAAGDAGNFLAEAAALPAPLAQALTRLPSGEPLQLRVGRRSAELLVLASYDQAGMVCREFELDPAGAAPRETLRGMVCRDGGAWQLRALVHPGRNASPDNSYLPASGGGGLAPALGLQHPLTPGQERQLLDRGWH